MAFNNHIGIFFIFTTISARHNGFLTPAIAA